MKKRPWIGKSKGSSWEGLEGGKKEKNAVVTVSKVKQIGMWKLLLIIAYFDFSFQGLRKGINGWRKCAFTQWSTTQLLKIMTSWNL